MLQCWLAEAEGQVVGFAEYVQFPGIYHPRKFDVGVGVLPAFRGRGIGAALYETLREALRQFDPISLTCGVREDWPEAVTFAERRGFVEVLRNWESQLDLTAFDPDAFSQVVAEAQARGYEFRSYADLASVPEIDRRIHAQVLKTGLTAVRRAHRGSGVAKALKVCALRAAKAAGYKQVKTWNATYNHGMLAINSWLGFERQPAWISYKLQIHPEE